MPEPRLLLVDSLQPVDHRGLHEEVLTQLLLAIRSGQLEPGERLREADIAERLKLSRGTVREAIRRLEQEGLVVSMPHRGTYIARIDRDEATEIYSIRRLLEAFAVRLAVPRVDESAIDELTATIRAMLEAARRGDLNEHLRSDLKFHEQICLLSGHRYLHRIWSGLALKLWLYNFGPQGGIRDDLPSRANVHFELIDLLRRKETDAAVDWIERHINNRAQQVIEQLSRGDEHESPD